MWLIMNPFFDGDNKNVVNWTDVGNLRVDEASAVFYDFSFFRKAVGLCLRKEF